MLKYLLAATAALTLAAPSVAQAQDVPSYAQQSAEEQIRGRVYSFDGGYSLAVRDERGYIDNVQLHDGTIINPTGLTLEPGMVVSIVGENDGDVLAADEIDTPYQYDDAVAYYGGHPWDYYGPTIGLSFFFGNTGWWHGADFGGGYHYDRGARVYGNARIVDRANVVNRTSYAGNASGTRSNVGYTGTLHPNPGHMIRYAAPAPAYRAPQQTFRAAAPAYRAAAPAYRTAAPAYRAPAQANRAPAAEANRRR